MLNIRLSRTGKTGQPSFRILIQEHTAAVKGKFIEEIGYYRPTTPSKEFKIDSERAKYWLSVGAQPSDSMAVLLKKNGFEKMERFIEPRNKKRKNKNGEEAGATTATNAGAAATVATKEAPAPLPEATSTEQPKL